MTTFSVHFTNNHIVISTVLLEEKWLHALESILQMHNNKDCFFLFCEYFISKIVGISVWRDSCTKQKVSEIVTISDEAFAYLLVENYWDDWSKKELEEYFAEACFDNSIMKRKKRKTT